MPIDKNIQLNPWETVDDLQIGGYLIIQDSRGFKFGTDAVLLANFAKVKKGQKVADFCTGSGVIPILLAAKTSAGYIAGIEIQHSTAEMASRSILMNNLCGRVEIIEGDIREAANLIGNIKFDVVTCNPPYMHSGGGMVSHFEAKALSRHEILCSLEDVFASAAKCLKFGGRLYMVHKAERLPDLLETSRRYKLEPKQMRLIYPSEGKKASLVLLCFMLGAGAQLDTLPPLFIKNRDGQFSAELKAAYNGDI